MKYDKNFNLVSNPWIPVININNAKELVSLETLFNKNNTSSYKDFTYTQVNDKVALLKFLITLTMAAGCTPEDNDELSSIINNPESISDKVSSYLQNKKELFSLYNNKPFLQSTYTHGASGEVDLIDLIRDGKDGHAQTDRDRPTSIKDKDIALMLIRQQCYSTNKKYGRTNTRPHFSVLHPTMVNKPFLTIFVEANTIAQTIALNLMTSQNIESIGYELGTPLWEYDLNSQQGLDLVKENLQNTFLGNMVAFDKNLLVDPIENKVRYSEGYPNSRWELDNSYQALIKLKAKQTVDGKKEETLVDAHYLANPRKKLWREFSALLITSTNIGVSPRILNYHRYKNSPIDIKVVCYGLETSYSMGLYYVKASLESAVLLPAKDKNQLLNPTTTEASLYKEGIAAAGEGYDKLSKACYRYDIAKKNQAYKSKSKIENYYWDHLDKNHPILIEDACSDPELKKWKLIIHQAKERAFDHLEKSDIKSLRAHTIAKTSLN